MVYGNGSKQLLDPANQENNNLGNSAMWGNKIIMGPSRIRTYQPVHINHYASGTCTYMRSLRLCQILDSVLASLSPARMSPRHATPVAAFVNGSWSAPPRAEPGSSSR